MQPLDHFTESYKYILSLNGHGVNTPLSRQWKQIVKNLFNKAGFEAMQAVEREHMSGKQVNPSITRPSDNTAGKVGAKTAGEARRLRNANRNQEQQEDPKLIAAQQARMLRLNQRGVLETPKSMPVSGALAVENVAAKTVDAVPINTQEAYELIGMDSKNIVQTFGGDRIRATLEAFDDSTIDLKKSDRQLASILKKRLSE
jgi:hypothetical protein